MPAAGVIAGLLAGLFGIGGGIVMVPALFLLLIDVLPETALHVAIATSLAAVVLVGAVSAFSHHRRGAVLWPVVARLLPGILLGALAGSALLPLLPQRFLLVFFALFLFWVAWDLWRQPNVHHHSPLPFGLHIPAFLIGCISVLAGIGGGTLSAPFLARMGHAMQRCVATAAATGVFLALMGSMGNAGLFAASDIGLAFSVGYIWLPAVGLLFLPTVLTAPLGAHIAHTLPSDVLKRIFAILLLVVAALLLWRTIG